jgi:hypothetical protein
MKPYAVVMNAPVLSQPMRRTGIWIRTFICNVNPKQLVVGNRLDNNGIKVEPDDYVNNRAAAHVCLFVLESLQTDHFWIEESSQNSATAIERLLRSQISLFKKKQSGARTCHHILPT